MLNAMGVLLLAASAAAGQLGGAHVGGKKFLRSHLVVDGPPPPGGPIGAGGGAPGDPNCPPGMGGGPGGAGMGGAGMGGPGMRGRRFPNVRSQVYFVEPPGMKIGWQTVAGGDEKIYLPGQLTVPARYNFRQGYIYRLKLTDIPGRPGLQLYPTVEIAPSTPATDAYLTHNPIPAQLTEEDFDQVTAGNFVTKVVYLPDPKYQELAIATETLVSTRLEPGVDPILEADRRGTILMILRIGAIDLEMPTPGTVMAAPGVVAGPGGVLAPGAAAGTTLPPGSLPPGSVPAAPRVAPPVPPAPAPNVPVDTGAPVSPAPTPAPPEPAPPVEPAAPAPAPPEPGAPPAEAKPADPAAPPAADPAAPPAADPAAPPAEPPAEMPKS